MNKMLYFYVIVMWMFTTLCLSDSFNDFEGFLMPSIGSYLESDSNIAWASALILGVQMKMIMLIQDAEKNENSSSKIYEMTKWSFDNALLVTDWNIAPATLCFISIEIPDGAQKNVRLDTVSNVFNQEGNL